MWALLRYQKRFNNITPERRWTKLGRPMDWIKKKKNYFCPRKVIPKGRSGSLGWVGEAKGIVVSGCQRGLGGGVGEEGVLSVPSLSLTRTTESGEEKVDFGEIADRAKVTWRQWTWWARVEGCADAFWGCVTESTIIATIHCPDVGYCLFGIPLVTHIPYHVSCTFPMVIASYWIVPSFARLFTPLAPSTQLGYSTLPTMYYWISTSVAIPCLFDSITCFVSCILSPLYLCFRT